MVDKSLLPPHYSPLEHAVDKASAAALEAIENPVSTLWNPYTCPAEFLPWLAWAQSLDEWDVDWSEQTKREAIAGSPAIHRIKGTVHAVEQVVALYGASALVQEWFEQTPEGAPGTFIVHIVGREAEGGGLADQTKIIGLIEKVKRKSQHFTMLVGGQHATGIVLSVTRRSVIVNRRTF